MKINFQGDYASLLTGIEALQADLGFAISEDGVGLTIEQQDGKGIRVFLENDSGRIIYGEKIHFYRAFGLFIEHYQKQKEFTLEEQPQFSTVGPMLDFSRNAVMNMTSFQGFIRKLALMGFNSTMLYMEDTYEIKNEPYFGYMRGRYTQEELKQMDDYAHNFGIELIPCIQTLAHLEEFLKWRDAAHLKDTRGALLVESEATYQFVENMISSVSKPFRTKRIHIGMDEAEELGRGIYLNKFGYKDRLELMTDHLKRVLEIVKKYGLEPMMWSDMFIKLASSTGDDHYNMSTEIPKHIVDKTPKEVQLMYWDYFHTDENDYKQMINKHKAFGKVPAFAGGIWVWNTFSTNYGLSLRTTDAALNACKKEGIQDVFVTLWGDDGYENNPLTALLGLQMYAEHAYSKELDRDKLRERVKFCTGIDEEAYLLLNELDEIPGVSPGNMDQTNPSKFLLWQDVLIGLFDKHVEGLDLYTHYSKLENKIKTIRDSNCSLDYIFEVPEKLSAVLSHKSNIGLRLKKAYDARNNEELKIISENDLPNIIKRVEELRKAHRDQWLRINKPFGWEVIDIRYGGLLARLDTASKRINDFIENRIDTIEELDEERLYFYENVKDSTGLGWCSYYYRIASPNVFFHVLPIY